jgi:hypothetical protein
VVEMHSMARSSQTGSRVAIKNERSLHIVVSVAHGLERPAILPILATFPTGLDISEVELLKSVRLNFTFLNYTL